MTEAVICDIDGTLADCTHRRHFVERPNGEKDFKSFLDPKLVIKDRVIEPVKRMVQALHRDYPVIYVSGRAAHDYDVTLRWLRKNELWFYPHKLYLREDGDTRHDVVFKLEILEKLRAEGWRPFLAIDDRNSVVQAWRDAGLVCAQVAPGDF
jgi:uncharacterized HAD superfamily protein